MTKISLFSATAQQRYLEYFMGANSLHLFVFGSYTRRWLLRRSGSSSILNVCILEGKKKQGIKPLHAHRETLTLTHFRCVRYICVSHFDNCPIKCKLQRKGHLWCSTTHHIKAVIHSDHAVVGQGERQGCCTTPGSPLQ